MRLAGAVRDTEPCHLLCSPPPHPLKKKKKRTCVVLEESMVIHSPACGDCKMPTGPFILSWRMVPKTTCRLSTFSKPSDMAVAGSQGPQSLVRQRRLHAWVSPGWFRRKCFPLGASDPLRGLVDEPAGAGSPVDSWAYYRRLMVVRILFISDM